MKFDEEAKQVGLKINEGKTKTMTQTRKKAPNGQTLKDYNFKLQTIGLDGTLRITTTTK